MMRSQAALVTVLVGVSLAGEPVHSGARGASLDLVMPGAQPSRDDDYLCSAFDVKSLTQEADNSTILHVTGFVPNADANKAHHMLLYTCNKPVELPGKAYDCLHHSICRDGQSIMFAWAKNAPATTLPPGVSFTLDPSVKRYLVLQVHYAHQVTEPDYTALSLSYTPTPTRYQAGILLMLRSYLNIPPNTAAVHGDINCKVPSPVPLHLFAYRTHAHALSPVITGYVYNEEGHQYREIARGSPQWPQAFYPMTKVQTVYPGKDILAARCTYNSTGKDKTTNIGATAGDEMCNLYIMFFSEPGKVNDFLGCTNEQEGEGITRGLPEDSDKAPEKRPELEAHAHDLHSSGGPQEINYAKMFEEEQEASNSKKKGGLSEGTTFGIANFNMTMPGVRPSKEDDYICTGVSMTELAPNKSLWVTKFEAVAQGNRAHHMIISRCKVPVKTKHGATWDCAHHAMCKDSSKIMFAWAKHAQPTQLPPDVGFQLEPDDFIVLQVHYAKPLEEPDHSGISIMFVDTAPKYTAGMFLLLRSHLTIPPETPATHGDVNCAAQIKSPVHVFAYRTHAHNLGSVISGYRYTPGSQEWAMVAKGNPNWPQAFYPMEKEMIVNPGEILAARCTYDSTGHATSTKIGHTGGDEMCNLYLMFYTLTASDDFVVCVDEQNPGLTSQLPEGNDTPLPANPELEHRAMGQPGQGEKEPKALPGSDFSVVPNWPSKETADSLGQISGVAVDIYGNAIIFHRGDRQWNGQTFKWDNTYNLDKNVPIPVDTVVTVNQTGHTVNSWGKGLFFLPHMITVDSQNNIWMTDVALHQVFKFAPYGGDHKPLITLGEKFVPGSDDAHYCKPTSVAVSQDTLSFFVSDGYCNSRVIKYGVTVDSMGTHVVKKITEWGKGAGPFTVNKGPNSFNIPHGLALAEDKGEVCVADRENGRVQCFTLDGDFTRSIQPEEFGSRIFSVAYTKAKGGHLHAVSGPELSPIPNPFAKKPTGYIIDMNSGSLSGTWNVPGGLQNPHDIAVSDDGNIVYVVELNPFKVWKLTNGAPQPNTLSPTPAVPALPSSGASGMVSKGLELVVPADVNSSVVMAAAISVPLTILIALCLAVRRCRKRGRGTMAAAASASKSGKNWSVGDILGRSKDGFKPLNTEDADGLLDDDSDSEVRIKLKQ